MNGTSHLVIGCGVAVAMSYVGMKHGDINLCVAALAAPVGAMLPDIDHNNTKLGSQRKEFTDNIRKVATLGGVGMMLFTAVMNLMSANVTNIQEVLFYVLLPTFITYAPVIVCVMLATSNAVKKRIKFFTKHRGIMHTLFPVIALYMGAISFENKFMASILLGLAFGYTSHLLADCETIRGCPLLWPLYKDNIRVLKITTGTAAEKLILLLDLGGLACLAYLL